MAKQIKIPLSNNSEYRR